MTAIRRLREIDEATFLPRYIDWFKNAKLDIYEMGKGLFDFNGALDVALGLVASPRLKYHDEELGMVYLAATVNLWWDKYPGSVREKVLRRMYYSMVKICDEKLWSMMSQEEREFITSDIRIASVNDATIHPFLESVLKSRRGNKA